MKQAVFCRIHCHVVHLLAIKVKDLGIGLHVGDHQIIAPENKTRRI